MSATDAPLSRAARLAEVRRLDADHMSARAIARQLGVGKDTVRRDLEALRAAAPATGAPGGAPHAPDGAPHAPDDAPPGTGRLTVAVDDDLRAHLDVLATAGHSAQSAVATAMQVLADIYRSAWDYEIYPVGVRPRYRTVFLPTAPEKGPTS